MRLTCSGVSGDFGRTPGFSEPAWGGGVEGRSAGMAEDLSQDAFQMATVLLARIYKRMPVG